MIDTVRALQKKADSYRSEAQRVLIKYDGSPSRIITLDATRKQLKDLSVRQDELFHQGLKCIEHGIYRAAHVMAWAAFIDYLEEKLASDGLIKVKAERPDWSKYMSIEDIRENTTEFAIIEIAKRVNLLSKAEMKTLHGLLSLRNECAHPTGHNPGLNESLGYVAQLLNRIKALQLKIL